MAFFIVCSPCGAKLATEQKVAKGILLQCPKCNQIFRCQECRSLLLGNTAQTNSALPKVSDAHRLPTPEKVESKNMVASEKIERSTPPPQSVPSKGLPTSFGSKPISEEIPFRFSRKASQEAGPSSKLMGDPSDPIQPPIRNNSTYEPTVSDSESRLKSSKSRPKVDFSTAPKSKKRDRDLDPDDEERNPKKNALDPNKTNVNQLVGLVAAMIAFAVTYYLTHNLIKNWFHG